MQWVNLLHFPLKLNQPSWSPSLVPQAWYLRIHFLLPSLLLPIQVYWILASPHSLPSPLPPPAYPGVLDIGISAFTSFSPPSSSLSRCIGYWHLLIHFLLPSLLLPIHMYWILASPHSLPSPLPPPAYPDVLDIGISSFTSFSPPPSCLSRCIGYWHLLIHFLLPSLLLPIQVYWILASSHSLPSPLPPPAYPGVLDIGISAFPSFSPPSSCLSRCIGYWHLLIHFLLPSLLLPIRCIGYWHLRIPFLLPSLLLPSRCILL